MADISQAYELARFAYERRKYNSAAYWTPYPKQAEFIELTATKREAALFAGNQVGKSMTGAFITYAHATGRYPPWWTGARFDKPTPLRIWVASESTTATRDVAQEKLFGTPGLPDAFGTGMIPKECIVGKPSSLRGTTDAYDTVHIKHVNGTVTALSFKSYLAGREVWQGAPVDFLWLDEEPPMDIYAEAQARTTATKGNIICTFTPLKGSGGVVMLYLEKSGDLRGWQRMAMLDAGHLTEADIEEKKQTYLPHEWDARIYGMPARGEGAVWTAPRETVEWTPPPGNGSGIGRWAAIPDEWLKIGGVDFGMGHPFAYALCAWDRDNDAFYVLNGFRIANELVLQHAKRIREMGGNVPVAWPQDGHARDRQSGEPLASVYKREGVLMLPEHATMPDGSVSLYGSVAALNELMNNGKFRVNRVLTDWFSEFDAYHYKDGKIVTLIDDFLSATRYAWMMRRRGRAGPIMAAGPTSVQERRRPIRNFDLFTGQPFPEGDPRRYL